MAITYYLFKTQYHSNFIADLGKADKDWILLTAITGLIPHFFRALRWKLLLQPIQKKPTSTLNAFNAIMIGYLANLALPRAGELLRCAWLSKKEEISTISLIGTVITERIIDLLVLVIMVLIGLGLYFEIILHFIKGIDFKTLILAKLYLAVALIIFLMMMAFVVFKIFTSQNKMAVKIKGFLMQLKEGLLSLKRIKSPYLFVFYTIAIWFFYILSSYCGFKMMNQTAMLNFSDALLTVIAGSFGMIAPIQGGIGAFHFMVSQCLVFLNINAGAALVYATILHAIQTLVVIVFGTLALVIGVAYQPHKKLNGTKP
ncbi:flippase-like domain-containing protein [Pedobacter sp. SD-b]|uniref:Flippase-like domain-containing protein n=1 Tax=Pedobacter segetis TaxID=2793069 RepID=A0ABS1BJ33_9SPHI|nr:flippase-like domain-containing protein [Pedobacter segetis]